jgi:glycogen(starch) synthase
MSSRDSVPRDHARAPERVLITADAIGGVWTFALELSQELAKAGTEVVLATLGGAPTAAQVAEAERIPGLRLCISDFKLEWMEDPWDDVAASGDWLLELESCFRPGLVHLNSFGHGALPWNSPLVLTAHSCVASWWQGVKGEALPDTWSQYRLHVVRSLESADVCAVPSRHMLECLRTHYGVEAESPRWAVIPNGRAAGSFYSRLKEPFVFSAGRLWDEAKNISAVARVSARIPWPVYIAGEARRPGGDSTEFPGCHQLGQLPADTLAGFYARAAIYALPARYEPFGLTPLEAALSGCALILGDIPSLREIWQDAAIFVPPGDLDCLSAALRELIEDPVLRNEFALRGKERAQEFTPGRMASAYLSLYRQAMAKEERVPCVS